MLDPAPESAPAAAAPSTAAAADIAAAAAGLDDLFGDEGGDDSSLDAWSQDVPGSDQLTNQDYDF
jgi:membrane protein involved in colicin uptake